MLGYIRSVTMLNPLILMSSSSMSICFIMVTMLIVYFGFIREDTSGGKPSTGGSSSGGGGNRTTLAITSGMFDKKKLPPWNIDYIGNRERLQASNGQIKLIYGKNAHGGGGGAKFTAYPGKFPREELTFGYDVYFPDSFEWKKGGKLPGMCIGKSAKECATGGDWKKDEGSARIMWRSKDGKNAYAIAYIYMPIEGEPVKAYNKQGPVYKKATDPGTRTGHDVWHGELPIKKGWNRMSLYVKMNTPGKTDGILELQVNGVKRRAADVRWRDNKEVRINNINFVSFFGGSGDDWNSPSHETYTLYKNVFIQ
jgi:hypothetical protein